MRTWAFSLILAASWACNGDKTEPPPDEGDTDTDTDADTDTDTDADTDTDTDTDTGPCPTVLPTGTVVDVGLTDDLALAVAEAEPGDTLLLESGTYAVVPPLVLDKALTLRSSTGVRGDVVLDGDQRGGALLEIRASDVTVAHLTLANSGLDAVSIVADTSSRSGISLWDLAITDPGRVAIVATGDYAAGFGLDESEIACVDASLSAAGRVRIPGECETGGIDAYGARDVVVRDSTFTGFWCEDDAALVGIRFWRGSRDITITRNILADAATGIVIGEGEDTVVRPWSDDPCSTAASLQAVDCTVTNNIVFGADDDLVGSADGFTVGIRAESSCRATILHNSVYGGNEPVLGAIRQGYATTTGVIANNLVSHDVVRVDGALADAHTNVENAPFDSWYFPAQGDFHTAPGATWAINQGDPTASVPVDLDGEPRADGQPDIGADER